MNYLSPSDYLAYGLEATTPDSWVTSASTVIDAHCRRATLGVTQYDERRRIAQGRNSVRVTYVPLTIVAPATSEIVSARGRYAMPRRGEWPIDELTRDVALTFGLPGSWTDINVANIDVYAETGELSFQLNAVGLGFSEVDVSYTAGLDVIPDKVKVACAQIVRNLQATPALNVSGGTLDRMHLEYFSDTLVDTTVQSLLAPYVAQKVG
ncbi:MAG TPA: hypothetical protein VH088_14920 [Terriglobales bacterium]|nr:hypothetical protein [Terriglobales bacterium]